MAMTQSNISCLAKTQAKHYFACNLDNSFIWLAYFNYSLLETQRLVLPAHVNTSNGTLAFFMTWFYICHLSPLGCAVFQWPFLHEILSLDNILNHIIQSHIFRKTTLHCIYSTRKKWACFSPQAREHKRKDIFLKWFWWMKWRRMGGGSHTESGTIGKGIEATPNPGLCWRDHQRSM